MKKIIGSVVICIAGCCCYGQQVSPQSDQLAHHIANKMRDSLSLDSSEREQVYLSNISLQLSKDSIRQIYSPTSSLLQQKLQRLENRRDTLYMQVLSPQKYQLYMERKPVLISAN